VTNRRKIRNGFHGLSLGFSAIVCALACSSGDEDHAPRDAPGGSGPLDLPGNVAGTPPAGDQLSPACDDTPLSTACSDSPRPGDTPPSRSSPGTSAFDQ
jgi:hypothetical protein